MLRGLGHDAKPMTHPGRLPGPIGLAVPMPFYGRATPASAGSSPDDPDPDGQQLHEYKGYPMFFDPKKTNWAYYSGTASGGQWQWW